MLYFFTIYRNYCIIQKINHLIDNEYYYYLVLSDFGWRLDLYNPLKETTLENTRSNISKKINDFDSEKNTYDSTINTAIDSCEEISLPINGEECPIYLISFLNNLSDNEKSNSENTNILFRFLVKILNANKKNFDYKNFYTTETFIICSSNF